MYTKLLLKIECLLLIFMTTICIVALSTSSLKNLFFDWTDRWIEVSFLVIFSIVFVIAILQIIFGLLEGKVFGLISGTISILTVIPFACIPIIPINIYLFLVYIRKDKQILYIETKEYKINKFKKT